MKFVSFSSIEDTSKKVGILSKDELFIIDVNSISLSKFFIDVIDLIQSVSQDDIIKLKNIISEESFNAYNVFKREKCTIHVPIEKPIHDILCVGVNYKKHLEETQTHFDSSFEEPEKTVYFTKRVTKAIGPEDEIDAHFDINNQLDYEVELGVVIGKTGVNIEKEDVEDYIFGYTVINDISARKLQKEHVQWFRGKGLDTFTSLGPCILHKSAISFPVKLNVYSRVNNEERQNSNTELFISDISDIISQLSKGMTLEAGDIIATGTPSGVGMGFSPPRYMNSGDVIECEIESIGILKNYVK
ncbi:MULTISPECIES: fumarylacetoacetate hydrolase family protein [unclassified Clostridioides]|uniref:fumarylacetoacetate hydrolase family protein n=1 Tax=unclassified Clostridioides TaxID=2635829 RepID=UPI001D110A50|nr:fumarylacetoacetate hydrolase family protein [Clostridioides sp. ZZV14-6150]MCC0661602.1 fumarylacetoacetate hydrolase family protein [Clostridioides sp. ZZV14-6154]MCC0668975.1 fumarylacetoacetate hydrolase family protein [Clostridioides sp. ZZV14-6153]MCC0718209.1 fumarylacetoacetate hydrolase family protein [Clostridioides sp. ZZV14-6105]MCC0721550.1 fumarylacetoacetate hydrolase family protein [Clostridioides sp. ZZV14-6104]MCC0728143.1 fumarylacetoacetate hydrolase family protein [Clos